MTHIALQPGAGPRAHEHIEVAKHGHGHQQRITLHVIDGWRIEHDRQLAPWEEAHVAITLTRIEAAALQRDLAEALRGQWLF